VGVYWFAASRTGISAASRTGTNLAPVDHLPTGHTCQPPPRTRATFATLATGNTRTPAHLKNHGTRAHAPTRTHGGMPARPPPYILIGVFLGVLFCVLLPPSLRFGWWRLCRGKWAVACFFCAKKKRQKKRRVGFRLVFCWWTSEPYGECVRSNVCATGIAPTLHSL